MTDCVRLSIERLTGIESDLLPYPESVNRTICDRDFLKVWAAAYNQALKDHGLDIGVEVAPRPLVPAQEWIAVIPSNTFHVVVAKGNKVVYDPPEGTLEGKRLNMVAGRLKVKT